MPPLSPLENNAILYAKTGKIEKLAECLARGLPLTFSGLLQNTAERGRLAAVEWLLAQGVDPNQRTRRATPRCTVPPLAAGWMSSVTSWTGARTPTCEARAERRLSPVPANTNTRTSSPFSSR